MVEGKAQNTDANTNTPLSLSFRDSAFMRFVNEAGLGGNNRILGNQRTPETGKQRPAGSERPTRVAERKSITPVRNKDDHSYAQQKPIKALGSVSKRAADGSDIDTPLNCSSTDANIDSANGDIDEDWDDLDNIELDSQTIRQLEETEERFYASQRLGIPWKEMQSSQEVVQPNSDTSPAKIYTAHSSTRSVPVTPTINPSTKLPPRPGSIDGSRVNDASGNITFHKGLGRDPAIRNNTSPNTPSVQLDSNKFRRSVRGTESASPRTQHHPAPSARSKVNLYPRLAKHIPAGRHTNHISSFLPPVLPETGTNGPTNHQSQYIQRNQGLTQQIQTTVSLTQPRFDICASETISNDPDQLYKENELLKMEMEQLKSKLYTKEGEVKIVRENLSRTEIENTHLQEQLSNQISALERNRTKMEADFRSEIEKLKTELLFQQQDTHTAMLSQVNTPRPLSTIAHVTTSVVSPSNNVPCIGPNFNAIRSNNEQKTKIMLATSSSTPTHRSTVTSQGIGRLSGYSPNTEHSSQNISNNSPFHPDPQGSTSGVSLELLAENDRTTLLDILTNITSDLEADSSSLVRLSICLHKAIQRPNSNKDLIEIHNIVCSTILDATQRESYDELSAISKLLLRALENLDKLREVWGFSTDKTRIQHSNTSLSMNNNKTDLPSASSLSDQLLSTIGTSLDTVVRELATNTSQKGSAIAALCQLSIFVLSQTPESQIKKETLILFNPCRYSNRIGQNFTISGLYGLLDLATMVIQRSNNIWLSISENLNEFEKFLLMSLKRTHAALVNNPDCGNKALLVERQLLILVASMIASHDSISSKLVTSMPQFTKSMVQLFLDEHNTLVELRDSVDLYRVKIFSEYLKCLHVVLSEIDDVVAMLGGDNSPVFFGFVAACTRMSIGEMVFEKEPLICDIATDLLAYVLTEEQALSIQNL